MAFDEYFSYRKLLIHGNGTNGSQTIVDVTGKTVTANGNVQISTAQSKFNGSSILFDGNGDYLQVGSTSDLVFGTGDYTIEFWIFSGLSTYMNLYDGRPLTTSGYYPYLGLNTNGSVTYYVNGADRIVSSAGAVQANTWTHVAVSRTETTTNLFVDGTKQTPWTDTSNYASNASYGCRIGFNAYGANEYFNGYFAEIRITKGRGEYTDNFTPPAEAFGDSPYPVPIQHLPVTGQLAGIQSTLIHHLGV